MFIFPIALKLKPASDRDINRDIKWQLYVAKKTCRGIWTYDGRLLCKGIGASLFLFKYFLGKADCLESSTVSLTGEFRVCFH